MNRPQTRGERDSGFLDEPLCVRIPAAVRLTGIGRSKLYQLIRAGEIEMIKVGASTLIPMSSLRSFIELSRRGGQASCS